jgi:hypothetical protein
MPIGALFMGLRPIGVLAGECVFVGMIRGAGAGKLCISTEPSDSVDLRFFDRVGAIVAGFWFENLCEFADKYWGGARLGISVQLVQCNILIFVEYDDVPRVDAGK